MEELDLNAPGGAARDDPAMLAAWAQADQLRDHEVVDVNGHKLGRVTRCFAEEGTLVRFDVTLSENAKGILGTQRDVASIPPIAIADVDETTVRLSEAAEQILDPEDPRPAHAHDTGRGGAMDQPRKVR